MHLVGFIIRHLFEFWGICGCVVEVQVVWGVMLHGWVNEQHHCGIFQGSGCMNNVFFMHPVPTEC